MKGKGGYHDFLMNEAYYSALTQSFPDRAERLFAEAKEDAKARCEHLQKLVKLYEHPFITPRARRRNKRRRALGVFQSFIIVL